MTKMPRYRRPSLAIEAFMSDTDLKHLVSDRKRAHYQNQAHTFDQSLKNVMSKLQ